MDRICVWQVRLDASGDSAALAAWRETLCEAELAKADGFRFAGHAADYLTAHAALRVVLGHSLGVSPKEVVFAEGNGDGAKPALPEGGLRFNLSHTAGLALIAVSEGLELGVDVEWRRPMQDLDGMAREVMSETELALWLALNDEERVAAFYNLWTRKEAYLKGIGLGLYRSLLDVTVPVSALWLDKEAPVLDRAGTALWQVRDVAVPEGYSAAVCWEGHGTPEICVRELSRFGDSGTWLGLASPGGGIPFGSG